MMMNNGDESFGSMWLINYTVKEHIDISNDIKQCLLDKQSREFINIFDPPPSLSSNDYSLLFIDHFMKSRSKSNDLIEKSLDKIKSTYTIVQIGNKECLDELSKIESSTNFISWGNDVYWVNEFRRIYKLYRK